jgi:hypothetical protein
MTHRVRLHRLKSPLCTLVLLPTLISVAADDNNSQRRVVPSGAKVDMNTDSILRLEEIRPRGYWYDAKVPDTLDLADRAGLAINALIGEVNPKEFYGIYQSYKFNANPPHIEGGPDALYGLVLEPRNARTLPMLRVMSGSSFGLEIERDMMKAMLAQVQKTGEMIYPRDFESPAQELSYPARMGMLAFAAENWYGRDPNPMWLDWIDLLSDGLKKDAIHIDDRAYYPIQSAIDPSGVWHDMAQGSTGPTPYHTPAEPTQEEQGQEGTAKNDQTRALSTLVLDYKLTGNKDSLQLARELAREILRPALWVNTSDDGYPGNEHAVFEGHFHANVHTLIGLLDFADVDHDPWLKEFVREGYANAIRNGVVQVGWFPAWIHPTKFGRPAWLAESDEICGIGDMVLLAIRLSDDGLGDYWDDVDSIVRNQLTAQQVIDVDLMRRASGVTTTAYDGELNRFRGGFGLGGITTISENGQIAGCCTGNGSQALYYAWDGITRFHDKTATVNLFLNRASAWLDIDSYLPYTGKVVLHNKLASSVVVRVPAWLDQNAISIAVNGKAIAAIFTGRYLMLEKLAPKDVITLTFPLKDSVEKDTMSGTTYTIRFRSSTVVDISPRANGSHSYPLYLRGAFTSGDAPMRLKRRFVSDRLIPLGVY